MTQLEPIDGSVYAYQVSPHENLVYVTIAGPDEDKPMIVAFDSKDLDYLKAARKELRASGSINSKLRISSEWA